MSYRIGSFNVKNLSFGENGRDLDRIAKLITENKFDIVALQEVLSEGKILTGAKLSDIRGQAKAYDMSLKRRLGNNWASTWRDPESKAIYSPYLGNDKRGEGYAFLWKTDKFELPKKGDGSLITPYIERNYKTREENMIRLIRDPCVGRFKVIGRPIEIRLITTHIVYGKPKSENLDADLDVGAIAMRKNEFNILAGQIYKRVNDNHRDNSSVAYTILLGDYNLNLKESGVGKALIPEISIFDSRGRLTNSLETDYLKIYTLQNELSTLSSKDASYASNYDHFSVDEHTRSQVRATKVIDAVHKGHPNATDDEKTKFDTYRSTVSDHVPIVIEIDC